MRGTAQPTFAVLDEATSAINPGEEERLYHEVRPLGSPRGGWTRTRQLSALGSIICRPGDAPFAGSSLHTRVGPHPSRLASFDYRSASAAAQPSAPAHDTHAPRAGSLYDTADAPLGARAV